MTTLSYIENIMSRMCCQEREGVGGKGRSRGKGGEMTQTLYARMEKKKKECVARRWWPMPVISASQEAEIRRITVQSQTGQIVL
jgi:hypothetical protein